jgi:hypothetical protein
MIVRGEKTGRGGPDEPNGGSLALARMYLALSVD